MLKDVASAATVVAGVSTVVVASMVVAAFTVAADSTAVAAFAGDLAAEAFAADLVAADSAEGMAVFGEASEGTAEVGDTRGVGGTTAEVGVEAGVVVGGGAGTVTPTSDLAGVTIRGPIGPDCTLATTIIPIIHTTGVTILTRLIPAIHMATAHPATTRILTARM